ncbi:MFS transporter [Nocardia sp. NRRL S-836]|uniref:MFS transporter n=1 Tax=Nocardia sp. NRRL S-836 TaxID=1519492 RepID=UPI0009E8A2E3|nr:MFS transporter [Nocardia sp. NRRL S-836]
MRRNVRKNPTIVLVVVLLSSLSLPITLTGASVALPDIAADLQADLPAVQWVVNGYIAAFASFMLATGSLADMVGRRRVFGTGVSVFAAAGVLSALSWNVVVLDVLRVLAGIGGAAAAASSAAILASAFSGRARIRAFSFFGTALGVGLAFGPTVAGLLIEGFGWRAVFAGPAVVSIVVLCLVPSLPESREPGSRKVDWAGTATFTLALLLLIAGFVQGPAWDWSSPAVLGAFAGSLVLLVTFVVVERRQAQPMFDLGLLRNGRFIGISLAGAVIVSVPLPLIVYLPAYFTKVLDMSSGEAGVTLVLLTGLTLLLPPVAPLVTRIIPPQGVVVLAVALVGVGAAWLTVIEPGASVLSIAGPLLTIGAGFGIATGLIDGVAIGSVDPARAGTGAGMFNTVRLAIETIAIAVTGAVLATMTDGRLAEPGYTSGLHVVLWWMAGLSLALAAVLVRVLLSPFKAPVLSPAAADRDPAGPGRRPGWRAGTGRSTGNRSRRIP